VIGLVEDVIGVSCVHHDAGGQKYFGEEQYKNQQDLLDVRSIYRMQPRAIMRLGRLPSLFHKRYAIRPLGLLEASLRNFEVFRFAPDLYWVTPPHAVELSALFLNATPMLHVSGLEDMWSFYRAWQQSGTWCFPAFGWPNLRSLWLSIAGGINGTRTPVVMKPIETAFCTRVVGFGARAEKCRIAFWPIWEVIDDAIAMMAGLYQKVLLWGEGFAPEDLL
jgi:hypothetical protein